MTPQEPRDEISFEQAVLILRAQPGTAQLMYDSFLDEDLEGGGQRFLASEEFEEVLRWAGRRVRGSTVVDVGAGTGIASFAFAKSGARRVFAVEPDSSAVVGAGAIRRLTRGLPVEVIDDWGENIGLPDGVADLVYARQVLHHARNLDSFLAECARLLKPGGMLIASREHVVSDEAQREEFLARHVVHQLTGSEGAYELSQYIGAIRSAGLRTDRVFGPLDTVVNTCPGLSRADLVEMPLERWRQKLGRLGGLVGAIPIASAWMMKRIVSGAEPAPGRLFTFVAVKPIAGRRA